MDSWIDMIPNHATHGIILALHWKAGTVDAIVRFIGGIE
jgi:hypothetical protein